MRVQDLIDAMERIAPPEYAEAWDRVGLLAGDPSRTLEGPVLLTIDLTERVLAEAVSRGAGAVVAYHPPIFEPLRSLTSATAPERIVRGAIEAGIALYSPHTALDAAKDGVTDWLCEGLSAPAGKARPGVISGDCRALEPHGESPGTQQVKLVTFVPARDADRLRSSLATAGAGIIGVYRVCSFSSPGTGTFFGEEGATPATGQAGRLERVEELRLEMVCARGALPLAIETLREFHPYEEPAFDVYELAARPVRRIGAGRRLLLDQPAGIDELCARLKAHLGRARVRYALPDGAGAHEAIGVVPGAGASMLDRAIREGCDLFVTGEMRHHEIVGALHRGVGVLLAGHTNTERGYLPRLQHRLGSLLPGVGIEAAASDTDILTVA